MPELWRNNAFDLGFSSKQDLSWFPERVAAPLSWPLRIPHERTPGAWNHRVLLLDHALYGVVCPSDPSHLVFWRVDTSLLSEESLVFRIQMVIRKKAKLICGNPTRHIEYIPHLYSFLLAHPIPNSASKTLSYFIAVIEKGTKHPVTQAYACPVTGVINLSQFLWQSPHFSTESDMSQEIPLSWF